MTREALLRAFRTPPPEYGPVDCWWWEGAALSREKMRRQLEEMKAAGVHGTWYYPRYLEGEPLQSDPAYWTEEWWELFEFSLREHRRLGMVAWVSDWTAFEFFQHKVRAERRENPRLTGRRLVCYRQQQAGRAAPLEIEVPAEEEILHAAAYRTTEAGVDYATRITLRDAVINNRLTWTAPDAGWIMMVITAQPHDLDYLDPAVADRWLELHLGEFAERLPEFVGNTLEAYGPDEMYVLRGNILYSPALVARFRQEKGYDPLPCLGGLFLDIGAQTDKIRCDYYEVMVSLLDENFYRRIADWLHQRGMHNVTIATWGREDPLLQTCHYGDFFRMMRHFDVTGNEDPDDGPQPHEITERKFIDAKFSSSIAHLAGNKRSAVCAYWGAGWGATQQQNVAFTLANYAYGLNFYNNHCALYSTLGGWYEWVPPAVHFRQPYWQYWRDFTEWVRRLSCLMSQGVHVAHVAVFYPLTTMHAGWAGGENFSGAAREAGDGVMRLAKAIYRSGIDFDFIDDGFLAEAVVTGGELIIAGHAFRAVVLPPMTTIRRDTLEKIVAFRAAGGVVLACGRLPDSSPEHGRDDPVIRSLVGEMFSSSSTFLISEEQAPRLLSTAITHDVTVSAPEIYHCHRKAVGLDIVLLVNTESAERRVTVILRTSGEPEIWDPFTGDARPVYDYKAAAGTIAVSLEMAPYQGIVLAAAPDRERPRVTGHNLDEIRMIEPRDGGLRIDGMAGSGGWKTARVTHEGIDYAGEAEVESTPAEIELDGPWTIRLQPTLDNRWGDFRCPPADGMIGPEARFFRYREEEGEDGTARGWHETGFDDAGWPWVLYTHGPYWWRLGPFGEAHEPRHILDEVIAGGFDLRATGNLAARKFGWEPVSFSQQHGSWTAMMREQSFGGLEGVADDFLALGEIPGGQPIVRYLFTYVIAPEEGEWIFDVGGEARFPRQAWVNGLQVLGEAPEPRDSSRNTHYQSMNRRQAVDEGEGVPKPASGQVRLLQGVNTVLVRIVQPRGEALNTYAVFYPLSGPPAANPRIPVLRWFREPQTLRFDLTPDRPNRVGWYRFLAPPGLRSLRCTLHAAGVEAWVDGCPAAVQSGDGPPGSSAREFSVVLDAPRQTCAQVAFRIVHAPGRYAGAAFAGPVAFTCEEGQMPLGDWCACGLDAYSGIAVYSRSILLDRRHLDGAVRLDLGEVATVAEVFVNGKRAGVGMAQPFRFDITELVRKGENLLEVRVANTLANHMSSYPTRFIFPGQTRSGLLGPVRLQFARSLTIDAVLTTSHAR
jgi:hypothetical protein